MKTILPTLLCCLLAVSLHAGETFNRPAKDLRPATKDEIDNYAGIGDVRDAEQVQFSKQLILEAQRDGVGYIVITWTYKGNIQFYAMRLIESGYGYKVWQGPNPPMGYYTSPRWYREYPGKEGGWPEPMAAPHLAKTKDRAPGILSILRFAFRKCPVS